MKSIYSESFKKQAIEKALRRGPDVTIKSLCEDWGIGRSTINCWIRNAKAMTLSRLSQDSELTKKEKRPEDWNAKEKFSLIIASAALGESALSELCREKGIYPHHVEQWKLDLEEGLSVVGNNTQFAETKFLKNENKALKKELRRKEKALAETAALLVLQKKARAIWGDSEDD